MLEKLISLVLEAGMILKEGYHGNKKIKYKEEVDLLTQYDIKIENFLKENLQKEFKEYQIVAEESQNRDMKPKKAIYIDPIDGTTNFVHNIPFCCISLGLWEDGEPQIGVVYNPILDELFYAQKGIGTYMNNSQIKVSDRDTLKHSLIATGFPYTKIEKGKDYQWVIETMENLLPKTRDIRRLGSAAIDLCYVARGTFDAFYECNLKPWDVAAGILIVKEAGGEISNQKGEKYDLNDHIIVASNGQNHKELIENLADY